MGNVSGKKDETAGPSGTKKQDEGGGGEGYMMEYALGGGAAQVNYHAPEAMVQPFLYDPRAYQTPLMFSSQVSANQLRSANEMMHFQSSPLMQHGTQNAEMIPGEETGTVIKWIYNGKEVAVEGSWDNWKTREFLRKTGQHFAIRKVIPPGFYLYRFIVDGQWTYSPDLPQEHDEFGNIFNVLHLEDFIPRVPPYNSSECEHPSSPASSYNNTPFNSDDYDEKLPELPPLLQQSPLDHSLPFRESPEFVMSPQAAVLNHLYIQKAQKPQSVVALSSTHRFRKKYVTVLLYKPLKKLKK